MNRFTIDGVDFVLDHQPGGAGQKLSSQREFVLQKTDAYLEFYRSLVSFAPKKIVELGIFEGGSIVYLDKLFQPDKLVGVDIRNRPIEPLETYRKTKPHINIHYGTSQDDPALPALLQADIGGEIDLIIDDASHMYGLTRDTFLNCFNLLKPGGLYVIEDWNWSHQAPYQGPNGFWSDKPALTNLVFDLVVETTVTRAFASLEVFPNWVVVKRAGKSPFVPNANSFLRGREFPRI